MKLVKENLYNFHKTGDIKSGLDIGMKPQIREWLDMMGVSNYTINPDLTIDAKNVIITYKGITEFPEFIQFKKIEGNFFCYHNDLISLRGCPEFVGGKFDCSYNYLKSLEGGPIQSYQYTCNDNRIETLKGGPKFCRHFNIDNNMIRSLDGLPDGISTLTATYNLLSSLEGLPKNLERIDINSNPGEFRIMDVKKICQVSGGIYV